MTSFAALIASLASSVKRSTVGSSAVARDVAELAACITFHSLSLAVTSEVVRSTALVARSGAGSTSKSTTGNESSSISTTSDTNTTAGARDWPWASWGWARASQMTWLTTVVATSAGSSSAETQSWAVSLNVA